MQSAKPLLPVVDAPGLYADAVLTDDSDNLLFLSLWGRDTAIQEFRARLSLPEREGGLDGFRLERPDGRRIFAQVGDSGRLASESGRTSSRTIFGSLVHLWLYDRLATQPDRANRRALLLYEAVDEPSAAPLELWERLWAQVRETCHLPLLPHWRTTLLDAFQRSGWIRRMEGVGICAYAINLVEEEVEKTITGLIRSGKLAIQQNP